MASGDGGSRLDAVFAPALTGVPPTTLACEDATRVAKAFKLVDVDGSGTLNKKELEVCLHTLDVPPSTVKSVAEMVAEADADGSGELDLEEFTALLHSLGADLGPEADKLLARLAKLRQAFVNIDSDGSGTVSAQELLSALRRLGLDTGGAAELLSILDGDGSGEISWFEFAQGMGNANLDGRFAAFNIEALAELPSFLDSDKAVSAEEAELAISELSIMEKVAVWQLQGWQRRKKARRDRAARVYAADAPGDDGERKTHVLTAAKRRHIHLIVAAAIFAGCMAGALSAALCAVTEILVAATGASATTVLVVAGGFSCVWSVIEMVIVYAACIYAAVFLTDVCGLVLVPADRDRAMVAGALSRAALEIAHPFNAQLGVDPQKHANKCVVRCRSCATTTGPAGSHALLLAPRNRRPGRLIAAAAATATTTGPAGSHALLLAPQPPLLPRLRSHSPPLPRYLLLINAVLYIGKRGISAFLLKILLRRVLVRAAAKSLLAWVAIPVNMFWNVLTVRYCMSEVVICCIGPSAIVEIVHGLLRKHQRVDAASGEDAPPLSDMCKLLMMRGVGLVVTRKFAFHPNLAHMLRYLSGLFADDDFIRRCEPEAFAAFEEERAAEAAHKEAEAERKKAAEAAHKATRERRATDAKAAAEAAHAAQAAAHAARKAEHERTLGQLQKNVAAEERALKESKKGGVLGGIQTLATRSLEKAQSSAHVLKEGVLDAGLKVKDAASDTRVSAIGLGAGVHDLTSMTGSKLKNLGGTVTNGMAGGVELLTGKKTTSFDDARLMVLGLDDDEAFFRDLRTQMSSRDCDLALSVLVTALVVDGGVSRHEATLLRHCLAEANPPREGSFANLAHLTALFRAGNHIAPEDVTAVIDAAAGDKFGGAGWRARALNRFLDLIHVC